MFVGHCNVDVPWNSDSEAIPAHRRLSFEAVPWPFPSNETAEPGRWISVTLYTPHYKPHVFAVNVEGHPEPAQAVLDLVMHHGPSPASHLFNTVVPALPQRSAGSATLIRCHSAIRHMGPIGFAAVLIDLTRVGHRYFATVLPRQIEYADLEAYLRPLIDPADQSLLFYVGVRKNPWPREACVDLHDGDVVTVVHNAETYPPRHRYDQLFAPEALWTSLADTPQPDCPEKWCILYREQRYTICPSTYAEDDAVALVSDRLGLLPNAALMCTFPVCDLDVQGDFCPVVVAVMDVAAPAVSRTEVRDVFVFLDFRPLGFKPRFLHTNVPIVHLPSLLARFGIELPSVYRIGVYGGTRRGTEVDLGEHTTLLFHLLEAGAVPTSSSECSDDEITVPAPASPASPLDAEPSPVGPAHDTHHFEDTTIPAGHSWNVASSPLGPIGLLMEQPSTTSHVADDPPPWDVVLAAHEVSAGSTNQPEGVAGFPTHPQPPQAIAPAALAMLPDIRARAMQAASGPSPLPPASPQASVEAPTSILTFVFAPDFIPDIICLRLSLPAAVATFLTAVQAQRTGTWYDSFPTLVPVVPQPCEEFAVCVAAPEWIQDKAIILIDSRRMDERLFALSVPTTLSRESLILAAGYSHDAPVRIYVHGLMQPLAAHQRIALFTGMTVTVSPNIIGAPATFDLGTRLQSSVDWNPNVAFPCATAYPGSHFYILTDGMPTVFKVRPFRRAHFSADLAQSMQGAEHSLHIRASKPRFTDLYVLGQLVSGALVTTERLSVLPCPPARTAETRVILILDQRRILQGLTWRILDHPHVSVQRLADEYYEHCPADHIVSIRGAAVENRPDGPVLLISSGQVLTIEFIEDLLPDNDEDPDMRPPGDTGQDTSGPGSGSGDHHHWTPGPVSGPPRHAAANTGAPCRNRSRSPRQPPPSGVLASSKSQPPVLQYACAQRDHVACDRVVTCPDVFCHDALPLSRHLRTPVLSLAPAHSWCRAVDAKAQAQAGSWVPPTYACKLLQDPAQSHTHAGIVAQGAREAARLLGVRWPAAPEQPLWFPEVAEDGDPLDNTQDGDTVIEATFCLFSPDYHPEVLPLHMAVPQALPDLVDLVQTCRDRSHAVHFPRLIEIWPQPNTSWGGLLAMPDWQDRMPVICVDCTRFDGRLFAAVAPVQADRRRLLQIAGLSPAAATEVFLPDEPLPLDDDREVPLWTGLCVRFTADGFIPPVDFSLREMLRSARFWAARPHLDFLGAAEHYCIVTHNGQRAFRLLPHRSLYYRTDLAVQFGYAPEDMHFQPAWPLVVNATVFGRACRTVVVLDDKPGDPWEVEPISGLLDCRPMLLGWLRLISDRGWVDIGMLRDALSQSAPPAWAASFQDFPDHWTWTWIEPGQVIVAHFVPRGAHVHAPLITPVIVRPVADGDQPGSAYDTDAVEEPDLESSASEGERPATTDDLHFGSTNRAVGHVKHPSQTFPAALLLISQPSTLAAGSRPQPAPGNKPHSRLTQLCRGRRGASPLLFFGVLLSTCQLNRAMPFFCDDGARSDLLDVARAAANSSPAHTFSLPRNSAHPASASSAPGGFSACWQNSLPADNLFTDAGLAAPAYPCRRPVPTPCRGYATSYDATYIWHLEVLDTLLDESTREEDHWAFLAATLLETLEEHLGPSIQPPVPTTPAQPASPQRPQRQPQPSLSTLRPACPCPRINNSVLILSDTCRTTCQWRTTTG